MGLAKIILPGPKGTERVFYDPHDKQDIFHFAVEPNILYGGAAGGGKSHALRMDAYMRCVLIPGFRALLLRRTFPELRNTHIDKLMVEVPQLGGVFSKTENIARWPNGSSLEVGHCEDEAAVAKYLSTEYDGIYFDELVTFTLTQFKFISSRARTTKPGLKPFIRAGTNPGGENAYWVKRYFISKDVEPEEDPNYNPDDWRYIGATLDDNPYIDPTYAARLMALPSEALRQAYRFGNWDIFEGQYFSEWRAVQDERPWHVIDQLPTYKGVQIDRVPWIEVYRAIDWGYTEPGVCGWFAAMPDGRVIQIKEYKFSSMLARDVARTIKRESLGMKVRYTVADPSMWGKDGSGGESIAETFARNGVPLIEADNERINGWHRMHSWLQETTVNAQGVTVPMLQFYLPACPYTCRTIPTLVLDPNHPEDVKTRNTEDHAADMVRYALMSRPAPSRDRAKKTYPKGTVGYDIQQLLRKQRKRRRLGDESRRDAPAESTLY